jgi:hypothetical protein
VTEYDELLEEVHDIGNAHRSKALQYIPKMYCALRDESPKVTPEDARVRIEKDCIGIWSKRTILNALPDEAKDLEKQKAGRLRQKEVNSAAVIAAPEKEEEQIMIDTEGKPVEDTIQPLATTRATVADSIQTSHNNDDLLRFEFSIPSKDIVKYIFLPRDKGIDKGQFWVNGTLDKRTGEVISPAIGRISSQLD